MRRSASHRNTAFIGIAAAALFSVFYLHAGSPSRLTADVPALSVEQRVQEVATAIRIGMPADAVTALGIRLAAIGPEGILLLRPPTDRMDLMTRNIILQAVNRLSDAEYRRFMWMWLSSGDEGLSPDNVFSSRVDDGGNLPPRAVAALSDAMDGSIWTAFPDDRELYEEVVRFESVRAFRYLLATQSLTFNVIHTPMRERVLNRTLPKPIRDAAARVLLDVPEGWFSLANSFPIRDDAGAVIGENPADSETQVLILRAMLDSRPSTYSMRPEALQRIGDMLVDPNPQARNAAAGILAAMSETSGALVLSPSQAGAVRGRLASLAFRADLDPVFGSNVRTAFTYFSSIEDAIVIALSGLRDRSRPRTELLMYLAMLQKHLRGMLEIDRGTLAPGVRRPSWDDVIDVVLPYAELRDPDLRRGAKEILLKIANEAYAAQTPLHTPEVRTMRMAQLERVFPAVYGTYDAEMDADAAPGSISTYSPPWVMIERSATENAGVAVQFLAASLEHVELDGDSFFLRNWSQSLRKILKSINDRLTSDVQARRTPHRGFIDRSISALEGLKGHIHSGGLGFDEMQGTALQQYIDALLKRLRGYLPPDPVCGNGIIETGETCDCCSPDVRETACPANEAVCRGSRNGTNTREGKPYCMDYCTLDPNGDMRRISPEGQGNFIVPYIDPSMPPAPAIAADSQKDSGWLTEFLEDPWGALKRLTGIDGGDNVVAPPAPRPRVDLNGMGWVPLRHSTIPGDADPSDAPPELP